MESDHGNYVGALEPPGHHRLRSADGRLSSGLRARLRQDSRGWMSLAMACGVLLAIAGLASALY